METLEILTQEEQVVLTGGAVDFIEFFDTSISAGVVLGKAAK